MIYLLDFSRTAAVDQIVNSQQQLLEVKTAKLDM